MTQPSVVDYFSTRKRSAADEANIARAKKVLILDNDSFDGLKGQIITKLKSDANQNGFSKHAPVKSIRLVDPEFGGRSKVVTKLNFDAMPAQIKAPKRILSAQSRTKKRVQDPALKGSIDKLLNKMQQKLDAPKNEASQDISSLSIKSEIKPRTPPVTPTKKSNAMDNIVLTGKELSLDELKQKMSRSSRLADLKASIAKFKQSAAKLEEVEKKTSLIPAAGSNSPVIKAFKTIELEIISPQKSPAKPYLSPKKQLIPRKNLLGLLSPIKTKTEALTVPASPTKLSLLSAEKSSLTLPYKYRCLAELFRCIDVVVQIMYNRKETITFSKLKPAVEEMQRRNLTEVHLQQIKCLYPEAYTFERQKLRVFGAPGRQEQYELVLVPILLDTNQCEGPQQMTSNCLMRRQHRLYNILISKLKVYHEEFLLTLDPPLCIPKEKITRWHPEFDIERVPDIDKVELPPLPNEEKMTTGKEVLERARSLFSCNTRMERALEKLKEMQDAKKLEQPKEEPPNEDSNSLLKGIPKCLLEKIRAKQAAKALETMTRSVDKEKEIALYARLPELARLSRNTFVVEKKSTLQIDFLLQKLSNSFRSFLTNADLEHHLRTLASCVPGWITFLDMRGTVYVKLSKNADLNLVLRKLEKLLEEKRKL